jgi:hypothetical protein
MIGDERCLRIVAPVTFNNRVPVYYAPLVDSTTEGAGDVLPDFVIGQPDFTSNAPNRGLGLVAVMELASALPLAADRLALHFSQVAAEPG